MGNICRSPAAEGILRSKAEKAGLAEHYAIDSAGTYSGHSGDLPDPRMREAAQRRGYRLTHRARPVLDEDFSRFDMLIAMDERNYDALDRLAFTLEDKAKIYRMTDFSSRHDYDHVPDPYYEGREGFELVLDLLEDACTGLTDFSHGSHFHREEARTICNLHISPQLSRPLLRTAPVQNDMYTRREVYISDPAPYRQTLTCTAKDVFANDQAPAPDNNATVRNQDTPSLFVLLPSLPSPGPP